MRTLFLCVTLLTVSVGANCQRFIPPLIIDSAIYEVRKGRACDTLQRAQADELKKSAEKLLAQGEEIKLHDAKESGLQFIIDQWEQRYDGLIETIVVQKKVFKARLKRLWRVVIVEGVAIIVFVIILI